MRKILAVMAALALMHPALAEARAKGRAMLGNSPVSWSTVDDKIARSAGVAPPQSLVLFMFPVDLPASNVSEAQWAKEAVRQGVSVSTMKQLLGASVYVTKEGNVASCTMFAVEQGRCGKPRALSLAARVKAAESILAQSKKCKWTGFDADLHQTLARQNGAETATLWVAATCR